MEEWIAVERIGIDEMLEVHCEPCQCAKNGSGCYAGFRSEAAFQGSVLHFIGMGC
jgi:hypothetical protein